MDKASWRSTLSVSRGITSKINGDRCRKFSSRVGGLKHQTCSCSREAKDHANATPLSRFQASRSLVWQLTRLYKRILQTSMRLCPIRSWPGQRLRVQRRMARGEPRGNAPRMSIRPKCILALSTMDHPKMDAVLCKPPAQCQPCFGAICCPQPGMPHQLHHRCSVSAAQHPCRNSGMLLKVTL